MRPRAPAGAVPFSSERLIASRRRGDRGAPAAGRRVPARADPDPDDGAGGADDAAIGVGRWALQRRVDERVVGAVALTALRPGTGRRVEVRWRVTRECGGRDYDAEAAAAAIGYAIDVVGVGEVVAAVQPTRRQARDAAVRAGMIPIGRLVLGGRRRDAFAVRVAPVDPDHVRVREACPEEVVGLRQRVLRPHQAPSELLARADDAVDVAAVTPSGRAVGCARLSPEAPPWPEAARATWRLRHMAVSATARGLGVGRRLVDDVLSRARRAGAAGVWCAARTPSQGFYARCGFHVVGQPWDDPVLGPHVGMVTWLSR